MKYYIIAGEASGDLHGSNLMKELKKKDAEADFRFFGGNLMQEQGGTLVKHYKELAFMGFLEVILNLKTILGNISFCKKDIESYQPDCVIFIDYPGFNLRLAKFVKSLNIKTIYYISPQLWAWKSGRIETVKKYVDKMLVILPFEKNWYEERGVEVEFVGHPLLDAIENRKTIDFQQFTSENKLSEKPIIALLPGSRTQEIEKKLPVMVSMQKHFPDYQFVIAAAPSKEESDYKKYLQKDISIVFGKTYELLQNATAACVTSGTATLETALFNVPEVVCYKGSWFSYQIGKRLVKHIKYISLVNLIMDKEVVKELIQDEFNEENLKQELSKILNTDSRTQMLEEYNILKTKLGGNGASDKAANFIAKYL